MHMEPNTNLIRMHVVQNTNLRTPGYEIIGGGGGGGMFFKKTLYAFNISGTIQPKEDKSIVITPWTEITRRHTNI